MSGTWHGVLLSDLDSLAKTINYGDHVDVREGEFLQFYYWSNRHKPMYVEFYAEDGKLVRASNHPYGLDPGDSFLREANNHYNFK